MKTLKNIFTGKTLKELNRIQVKTDNLKHFPSYFIEEVNLTNVTKLQYLNNKNSNFFTLIENLFRFNFSAVLKNFIRTTIVDFFITASFKKTFKYNSNKFQSLFVISVINSKKMLFCINISSRNKTNNCSKSLKSHRKFSFPDS